MAIIVSSCNALKNTFVLSTYSVNKDIFWNKALLLPLLFPPEASLIDTNGKTSNFQVEVVYKSRTGMIYLIAVEDLDI